MCATDFYAIYFSATLLVTDIGQRLHAPSLSGGSHDVHVLRKVKRSLFKDGPKSPMEDDTLFKRVMSLLTVYEVHISI